MSKDHGSMTDIKHNHKFWLPSITKYSFTLSYPENDLVLLYTILHFVT